MDMQPRKSTRSSKGKPPKPFNWTPHGKSWTVKSKQVILPRQIGRTRLHVMPCAEIKRSGLSRAGNGFYLSQGILRAGSILAEYKGEIISIDDADKLQILVCSPHCCAFKAICREHLLHAMQLSDGFLVERARPLTSSVSEIPSGALIRRSRLNTLWSGMSMRLALRASPTPSPSDLIAMRGS